MLHDLRHQDKFKVRSFIRNSAHYTVRIEKQADLKACHKQLPGLTFKDLSMPENFSDVDNKIWPASRRYMSNREGMRTTKNLEAAIGAAAFQACHPRRSRLRPCLLALLAYGAFTVVSAMSSTVQAKELAMQDGANHYQPYQPGMELPEGVFPPMPGYTHQDLIGAATTRARSVLDKGGIEPALVRESLIGLTKQLNQAFEAQNVEYQISTWYQKPYANSADRGKSVADMAEHFGALAVRAATASLRGSPLLEKDRNFLGDYIESAGDGVRDLIAGLDNSGID